MAVAVGRMVTFGLDRPPRSTDYGVDAGWIWRGEQALLELTQLPLKGLHNAANAMAALALSEAAGAEVARLFARADQFRALAHRVELVLERAGVAYIDDSKGTNVGATLAAIEGLGRESRHRAGWGWRRDRILAARGSAGAPRAGGGFDRA